MPWVVRTLSASVDVQGNLKLKVEGLVVAGGRGIGTSLNRSIRVTLYCGPWNSFTFHNTSIKTKLSIDGDLVVDENLIPQPPDPCTSPVLLLRDTVSGNWIAAGVPVVK